jgi:hypothetical protein
MNSLPDFLLFLLVFHSLFEVRTMTNERIPQHGIAMKTEDYAELKAMAKSKGMTIGGLIKVLMRFGGQAEREVVLMPRREKTKVKELSTERIPSKRVKPYRRPIPRAVVDQGKWPSE